MHRGTRKVSFDVDSDSDDYGMPKPRQKVLEWTPRSIVGYFLPRKLRTYAIVTAFVLFILYISRPRSHQPRSSDIPHLRYEAMDWSRYAYSQYVTDSSYLCNAIMLFEALHRLGGRAERILFYPESWDTSVESSEDRDSQLLVMARDTYNVQLMPVKPETVNEGSGDSSTWDYSITKLYAFSQTQYRRILHIDSDVTILQNMDELFFLPPAPVAMPRAYRDDPANNNNKLTSLLILLQPAYREYKALMDTAQPVINGQLATNSTPGHEMYDMELLNARYANSALVLPHRLYGLVSGEFRKKDHRMFLGNDYEQWNPDRVLAEAKVVHFSDWPLPKPWVMWPQKLLAEMLPRCDEKPGTPEESGCRDREVWRELYEDFRKRRKDICKLLSYPAPD